MPDDRPVPCGAVRCLAVRRAARGVAQSVTRSAAPPDAITNYARRLSHTVSELAGDDRYHAEIHGMVARALHCTQSIPYSAARHHAPAGEARYDPAPFQRADDFLPYRPGREIRRMERDERCVFVKWTYSRQRLTDNRLLGAYRREVLSRRNPKCAAIFVST